jgi:hypothetical protein
LQSTDRLFTSSGELTLKALAAYKSLWLFIVDVMNRAKSCSVHRSLEYWYTTRRKDGIVALISKCW